MKVAAVQLDIAWEDKDANHRRIESMLDEAGIGNGAIPGAGAGAIPGAYVLLPELADTGFSFNLDRIADDRSTAWAADLARRRRIWLQMGHAQVGADGRPSITPAGGG